MYTRKLFLTIVALTIIFLSACGEAPQIPGGSEESAPPIVPPTAQATAVGTMIPAVQEAISDAPLAMAMGVVYPMPAGYVLAADVDVCLDDQGYTCYRTYDSDGTTIAVVSFDEAGYFARLPFGDGTATKVTDPTVLNELVVNQATDGCGTGCVGGSTLLRVPTDIEAIKLLAASFAPAPTGTLEPPTDWNSVTTLIAPPAPEQLPDVLMAAIVYQAPPENCAGLNDPDETCTTLVKQETFGEFTLSPNEAIIMTGDNIDLCTGPCTDSNVIVAPAVVGNKGDVWLLLNLSGNDVMPYMSAPHGSFRGFFTSAQWTQARLEHLLHLHLQRYQIPDPNQPQEFNPTPCPTCNCIPTEGCVSSRVRVAAWDGSQWKVLLNGTYSKTRSPYWFPR